MIVVPSTVEFPLSRALDNQEAGPVDVRMKGLVVVVSTPTWSEALPTSSESILAMLRLLKASMHASIEGCEGWILTEQGHLRCVFEVYLPDTRTKPVYYPNSKQLLKDFGTIVAMVSSQVCDSVLYPYIINL